MTLLQERADRAMTGAFGIRVLCLVDGLDAVAGRDFSVAEDVGA